MGTGIVYKVELAVQLRLNFVFLIVIKTVPLVHRDYQRLAAISNHAQQVQVLVTDRILRVNNHDDDVSHFHCTQAFYHAEFFHRIGDTGPAPDTRGVN